MTDPTAPRKKHGTALLIGGIILALGVSAVVGSAFLPNPAAPKPETSEPQYWKSPPISEQLSDEAREGCLALGMTEEQIDADNDSCLSEYWTVNRLALSSRTLPDWYADQKVELECYDEGYVPREEEMICELVGSFPPLLPQPHDPWWDAEAIRDPGRVTDVEMPAEGQSTLTEEDWQQAYDASLSAEAVPLDSIAMGEYLAVWCAMNDVTDPADGFPLTKTTWSVEEIALDARPCLVDLFAEHYNGERW